jgi:hypothetical protein
LIENKLIGMMDDLAELGVPLLWCDVDSGIEKPLLSA